MLTTAARIALPPSMTNSRGRSGSNPRSIRLASRALHTVLSSVLSSHKPSGCLRPSASTPQGDYDTVLGDQDAVDEDREQVQLAEITPEQLGQLLLGTLDETPRDG